MAKPLRTKEILTYLLKESSSGEMLYSQREISRTLGVSQTTIHRINNSLKEFLTSGHSKEELKDKDDAELNMLLLSRKEHPAKLKNNDFEIILKYLERPEENAYSLLKKIQTQLNNQSDSPLKLSGLSEKAQTFLKTCSYQAFNLHLHNFCDKKGYSDRFIFKPAEYAEIGVIPLRQKSKGQDSSEKPLNETGRFLFYVYLPFSRQTKITLADGKSSDFTGKIVTCLISFFSSSGFPLRIIGNGRLEEVFCGADLPLMKDYFSFCSLLYSCDRRRCVFQTKEAELIESIKRSETVSPNKKKYQERIDAECSNHNEKHAALEELSLLQKAPDTKESFIHDLGVGQRQENCHVRFQDHWYSSNYTERAVRLALQFCDGKIYFITKPLNFRSGQEILSRHLYYIKDESQKYETRYSTNKEDLPPNDEEALKYGLLTAETLLSRIAARYGIKLIEQDEKQVPDPDNPIIRIAEYYMKSRNDEEHGKYPQQTFKLLNYLSLIKSGDVDKIRTGCSKIVKTPQKTWGKGLSDLLFHSTMPEEAEKDKEAEKEPSPGYIPF